MWMAESVLGDIVRDELKLLSATELRELWANIEQSTLDHPDRRPLWSVPIPAGVAAGVWRKVLADHDAAEVRRTTIGMIQEILPYKEQEGRWEG